MAARSARDSVACQPTTATSMSSSSGTASTTSSPLGSPAARARCQMRGNTFWDGAGGSAASMASPCGAARSQTWSARCRPARWETPSPRSGWRPGASEMSTASGNVRGCRSCSAERCLTSSLATITPMPEPRCAAVRCSASAIPLACGTASRRATAGDPCDPPQRSTSCARLG